MTRIVFVVGTCAGFPVEVDELFWDEVDATEGAARRRVDVFPMRVFARYADCPKPLRLTESVELGFGAECRLELEFALRLSGIRPRDRPSPSTAPPPGVIWGIGPEDPASSFEVYAFYESEHEAAAHVTRAYCMLDKRPFKVQSARSG